MRILTLVLAATWCCVAVAQADPQPVRVGILADSISDFWATMRDAVLARAEESGTTPDFRMPAPPTAEKQNELVRQMIDAGAQALAICPIDPEAQREFLAGIADQIPLILLGKNLPGVGHRAAIVRDEYEVGRLLAQLVIEGIPEGMKIMVFCDDPEQAVTEARLRGFKETLARTETILDAVKVDQGDRMLAWAHAEEVLRKRPEIAAFVGLQPYHAAMLARAAVEQERGGWVRIFAYGEAPAPETALNQGLVHGIVMDAPAAHAWLVLETLVAVADKESPPEFPDDGQMDGPIEVMRPGLERTAEDLLNELDVQVPWLSEIAPGTP